MRRTASIFVSIAALSGGAAAQSSVTLFGVVDLSLRYVKNDEATYQLAQDGMAFSRLGFRGVEDLGGGLKAGFWLEGALGPDTGTGGASIGNGNPDTASFTFRRRSTLSLSGPWGELRLGRDFTPQFWNWTVFDPFGAVGIAASTNLQLQVNTFTGSAGSYGTLLRANNTVQYILPNGIFGPGLYGNLMVAAGEGALGNKMVGGRIGYAAGAFNLAGAYSSTDIDPATDTKASNWNVGGSWDFRVLKLSAFYSRIEVESLQLAGDAGQQNWYVGASAPFGQWNFKASWGQADGTGLRSAIGATQWALGADYNLSKRTAIYATYSAIDNEPTSRFRVTAQSSTLSAGNNSTGAELGVRHTF